MSYMRNSFSDVNKMAKVTNSHSTLDFSTLACKTIFDIFQEKNDRSYREQSV